MHDWITQKGLRPLISKEENCSIEEVTDLDLSLAIKPVTSIFTLVSFGLQLNSS